MAFLGFYTRASDFAGGIDNFTATFHDTDYTDRAVQFPNNQAGAISWGSAQTDIWIHWRQYFNGTHNTNADGHWWTLVDANGIAVARADITNGTTEYGISTNGSSYTEASATASPGIAVQTDVDVHWQSDSGGNDVLTVYHDGVQVATVSVAHVTSVGAFTLIWDVNDIGQGAGDDVYISEMMVANEDTRGLRLATLVPDAVGAETDWAGAFGDVIDRGDGKAATSDTATERVSFNVSAYSGPASPTSIRGVFVQCWATAGASGPANVEPFVRIASVNYDSGSIVAPDFSVPVIGEYANNPNTAVAWVEADFASLEIGVEAVA